MPEEQSGIVSNSRGLFDAVDYTGGDVEVIEDAEKYMNGTALKTFEKYKQIFTTNWLPPGQLEGNTLIKVYWDTNDADNGTAPDTASIRIYTDTDDAKEVFMLPCPYGDWGLQIGTKIIYNFNPFKSYKIEMWSENPGLYEGVDPCFVILDYIRLDELHSGEVLNMGVYNEYMGGPENVPVIQQGVESIVGNDATLLTATITYPKPFANKPAISVNFPTSTYNIYSWVGRINSTNFVIYALSLSHGTPSGVKWSSQYTSNIPWSATGYLEPPIISPPNF